MKDAIARRQGPSWAVQPPAEESQLSAAGTGANKINSAKGTKTNKAAKAVKLRKRAVVGQARKPGALQRQ